MDSELRRARWSLENGYYSYNPLMPNWNDEFTIRGGRIDHKTVFPPEIFEFKGREYFFTGSTSRHLVELICEDPEYDPKEGNPQSDTYFAYQGGFIIYKQDFEFHKGNIWQAARRGRDHWLPQFLQLMFKNTKYDPNEDNKNDYHRRRVEGNNRSKFDLIEDPLLVDERVEEVINSYEEARAYERELRG